MLKKRRSLPLFILGILAIAMIVPIMLSILLNNFIDSRIRQQGPYEMCRNFWGKTFICDIVWDGDFDNMEFTVPDRFKGRKLTDLGGYYGHGGGYCFSVMTGWREMDGGYLIASDNWLTDEELALADTYHEYQFTINLGKNIREIVKSDFNRRWLLDTVPLSEKQRSGDVEYEIVARLSYYFNVDLENETFYSEDGVVYWKETGKPATELIDSRMRKRRD